MMSPSKYTVGGFEKQTDILKYLYTKQSFLDAKYQDGVSQTKLFTFCTSI